jgi:flagellar basal-body rod modification protein FlgD
MTIIPPVTDPTGAGTAAASGSSNTSGLNQLDNSQTFLQLLVAQLENQDPTNPTDPTSFMTEIAQLTAVQSQTSLSAEEQTVAADSMIGLTVTGTGPSGTSLTGQVAGVLLSSSGAPTLEVQAAAGGDPQDMSLTNVTSVTEASPSTTT